MQGLSNNLNVIYSLLKNNYCLIVLCNSLPLTVNSMKQKLNTTPLVIQLPLGEGRDFTGIIDLLSMDVKVWRRGSDGSNFSLIPLLKVDPVTGKKDYVSLATLLGPSFKCVDLPLSRERIKDVLDHRAMLAEQVPQLQWWIKILLIVASLKCICNS